MSSLNFGTTHLGIYLPSSLCGFLGNVVFSRGSLIHYSTGLPHLPE